MMQTDNLAKYKLGLLILSVFAVLLTGYVVIKGASLRQDATTESHAKSIAGKLNNYTYEKFSAPKDLAAAGVKDAPSTISYTQKSDSSYEFCATYKAASDTLNATGIEDVVSGTALGAYTQSANAYDSSNAGDSGTLVIGQHKKGENCQTVTVFSNGLYDSNSQSGPSPGSSTVGLCNYDYGKTDAQNDAYYACLDAQSSTQFN